MRRRRGTFKDDRRPHPASVGIRSRRRVVVKFCEGFARTEVPQKVLRVVKMGRLAALQKFMGCVGGIVVSGILRRFIAQIISQQITRAIEVATAPFQLALSVRARTGSYALENGGHGPLATVLSIDVLGRLRLAHFHVERAPWRKGGGAFNVPFCAAKTLIHHGTTQVWTHGGVEAQEIGTLQAAAQVSDPDALV